MHKNKRVIEPQKTFLYSSLFSLLIGASSSARVRLKFLIVLLSFLAPVCLLLTQSRLHASSNTITVTNITDPVSILGNGFCSLREAIDNANSPGVDTTGGDCATGTGTDTIAFSVSGTITITSPLPAVANTSPGSLTIDGSGQTIIVDGANSWRIFDVSSGATLALKNLTIADANDLASSGGGIYNGQGTLTVVNSTLLNNFGFNAGGAIFNDGALTVTNSTFVGNSASDFGGGAIYNNSGTATITNSTVFANFTVPFSGNPVSGGGIAVGGGTLTVSNSILAGNSNGNCLGTVGDGGYNISDDGSCGFTGTGANSQTLGDGVNPLLDSNGLQDNGGSTKTIALQSNSPAIGAVAPGNCPSTDQRGNPRPAAGYNSCDAGAYEYGGISRHGTNQGGDSIYPPLSVNLYAGTTDNDLVVVEYCVAADPVIFTPPNGYTQLGSNQRIGAAGFTCGLFYHVWHGGDSLAASFSDDDNNQLDRVYIATSYSGENTSTPFDPNSSPSQNGASSASVTLSALSPSGAGDMLAFFGAEYTNGGGSFTPSYTSPLAQYNSEQFSGSWEEMFAADGILGSSGSTGDQTMTATGVDYTGGFMIAIQPATAATQTPTATATATGTPTATDTATATDTPTATPTPTDTATATATSTDTATATSTPTDTSTATATATATSTDTATATSTPTDTSTATATATATQTATATTTRTATATPTATRTATATASPTRTATATRTVTATQTPTATPTPVASLSVNSLNFGAQSVGTTSPAKSVNLSNTGKATLKVASIATTGDFAQTNNCKSSLAPGKNCTISVTFKPTSAGLRNGTLSVSDNAAGSPQAVSLSGTGNGNQVSVLPTSLTFGSFRVGTQSAAKMVTVTNNQAVAITLSAALAGRNPGDFAIGAGTTCGASLAATSSCVYSVTFKPLARKGRSATLNVSASPDSGSPHAVTLSGTGS